MSGDPSQTSTKLRAKAVEIIRNAERPLASHEIENWIRENDPFLTKLIKEKCSDYVRIILSVTQDAAIAKYKSLVPVPGVDKRSTFYGLTEKEYKKDEWALLTGKQTRSRRGEHSAVQQKTAQQKQVAAKPLPSVVNEKLPFSVSFPLIESTPMPMYSDVLLDIDLYSDITITPPEMLNSNWEDFLWKDF